MCVYGLLKIEICGSFSVINGSVDLDKAKITNVQKRIKKEFFCHC